jgi:ABC-type bacteriocin/lantibiotic exporter with double-glycine peptidase domain
MVLAHYGQLRSEEEVRQLLGTGPHGTPARAILQVAPLGFHVQLGRSNLAELATALRGGVPPMVFVETTPLDYWKQRCDHVAVVVGLQAASVSLNDPHFDIALNRLPLASFRQAWASNVCWAAFTRPQVAGS